jgi:hypothetical protein
MTMLQPGQRIALVRTDDPFTDLRPGDSGTVMAYYDDTHTVDVDWDRGAELSLRLDDGDEIRRLESAPNQADG